MSGIPPAVLRSWLSRTTFNSTCRLCLAEDEGCSSLNKPLYIRTASFRGTLVIREILNRVLQTKNYDEKCLPQNICEKCLNMVLKFFTFWQHCVHTEKRLALGLATLSKHISSLHSQVSRKKKKSKYTDQNSAILLMKSNKIEYLALNDSPLPTKYNEICEFLNRGVPKHLLNHRKSEKIQNPKIVKVIKDNMHLKSAKSKSLCLFKFFCSYCPESFEDNNDLTGHLRLYHHIVDVAECGECGKKFKTIHLLKQHVATHRGSNSKCIICESNFESPSFLENHVNKMHTEYKYKCPDCHELFQKERDVSIHQWNAHKVGYEYYCKVCGKKFQNIHAVKSHEDQHEGFECDRCGEKFNARLKLKTHLLTCLRDIARPENIMTDVEKFTCNYCSKSFYRKATLRQHILNLHVYPKKFQCPNCDKRVSTKTQLEAHMIVHTRERTEHCTICQKFFVTKYALAYHMRLHTGERPYPCDMCDERFLSASRRIAHVKRKHIGRTEQCSVCCKSYFSRYGLKRHMRRHFDPKSTLFENCI